MNHYETIFIVDPDTPGTDQDTIFEKVKTMIDRDGKVLHEWRGETGGGLSCEACPGSCVLREAPRGNLSRYCRAPGSAWRRR